MNPLAPEYIPSMTFCFRPGTIDHISFLSSYLHTTYQLRTAQTILHEWEIAPTLSTLIHNWSIRHVSQSTVQTGFSFLLYNISSLSVHLEELIHYISSSYPTIWALTGLHFNHQVNYRLASFFKSQYTIYSQRGTNISGGVCFPGQRKRCRKRPETAINRRKTALIRRRNPLTQKCI